MTDGIDQLRGIHPVILGRHTKAKRPTRTRAPPAALPTAKFAFAAGRETRNGRSSEWVASVVHTDATGSARTLRRRPCRTNSQMTRSPEQGLFSHDGQW